MITFYSGKYRRLELFLETEPDSNTYITLSDGLHAARKPVQNHRRILFPLEKYTVYTLSLGDAVPGLMYLTDCDNLPDAGIRFLQPDGSLQNSSVPSSFRCHLTPCKGQIGIPGNLCFFQGYYHIFYTCAPFPAMTDILYCGHAVSRDMLHWNQLPLFAQPRPEALDSGHITGGILPGRAVTCEMQARLYFIHSIRRRMGGEILREYPTYADTKDMLHFSNERPVPLPLPANTGPAFRSPGLTDTAEGLCLTAGCTYRDSGAVLLFQQTSDGWTFAGPLLRENTMPAPDAVDFFPVGRTHAVITSFSSGGTHTVRWYTGTFQNSRFRIRRRGTLDFGGDFYAPQTFTQNGRRILFAPVPGPDGCMTLPREVFTRRGCLCMRPAAEVYRLAESAVYTGRQENISLTMPSSSFLIQVRFSAPTDFRFLIGTENNGVCLRSENGRLTLETGSSAAASEPLELTFLEVFADGPVLEVFANDGEATGTKRFSGNNGTLSLFFADTDYVEWVRISPLTDCMAAHTSADTDDPDAPVYTFDFTDDYM